MKSVHMASLCLALAFGAPAFAQDQTKNQQAAPSQAEMMQRWQEFMTPNAAHTKLGDLAGSWSAEVKLWMNGPAAEPVISRGTAEYVMSLGGRFLQETFSGSMMDMPFSGIGYTGFDNFKKKYVGFWIDNSTTAFSTMEGTLDKDGKVLTMWGKMDDPMSGEKDKSIKSVWRFLDKNSIVYEVYDVTAYGESKPVMLITYARLKK